MTTPPLTPEEKNPTRKKLNIGGVLRCCVDTLWTTPVEDREWEVLQCKHAPNNPTHQLILKGDVWQWNHE